MKQMMIFITILIGVSAHAGYRVTGQVDGTVCSGFIIQHCTTKTVDAVRGEDGKLFEMTQHFQNVSEYRSERCTINVKSGRMNLIKRAAQAATTPDFYTLKDGEYEKINVERITFPCVKE